ncbi:Uncharacterised protein [Raoultella planticola]|uniref:Uncharacterized protein n=1 Tax=Raoultella planticola TaxID=575 RepID=A0A485APD9_RAOPL|nr:Uncharacterised protein [Raoultella planticola]
MKLHAGSQGKNPATLILRVNVPLRRQTRNQATGLFALRKIPLDQGIVQRDTGEAVAFISLIGLPKRQGDIGGGHGDPQSRGTGLQGGKERQRAAYSNGKMTFAQKYGVI